jgi:hypothetical protein
MQFLEDFIYINLADSCKYEYVNSIKDTSAYFADFLGLPSTVHTLCVFMEK